MIVISIEPNQLSRPKGMAQWLNREPIGQPDLPAIEPNNTGSIRLIAAQLTDDHQATQPHAPARHGRIGLGFASGQRDDLGGSMKNVTADGSFSHGCYSEDALQEYVTDKTNRSPRTFSADFVTDEVKLWVAVRTSRYDRRNPIRAIRDDLFNSDEALSKLLATLEAKHHAEQEISIKKWKRRIVEADSGDAKAEAYIALWGGREKVLTPKAWTFKFNKRHFFWPHTCWECGEAFHSKSMQSQVCSDACAQKRNIENTRRWRTHQPARTRQTATCLHCGHEFAKARSDARFCSVKCRVATHRGKKS